MASSDDILKEINQVLRAYNYIDNEDEDLGLEDLPSLVSHLLLLRVFTQECIKFAIPYEDVEEFCDFAIDYIYQKETEGADVSKIDIETIVDEFQASRGPKH
ncbi:MAG: hypothetical protein WCQ53_00620 [bacterium]